MGNDIKGREERAMLNVLSAKCQWKFLPFVGIQEYIIWREAMARDRICKIPAEDDR